MKTRAAVLRKGEPCELTELDLDEPKAGEVLIRYEAAGLCHSDEHIRAIGTARLPFVGGHETVGAIEKTGPGVTRVTISAAPQACADCLVPKDLMRGILGQTLGVPEDATDLMYPLDSPQER
ncbi:MAG TPA: alcohol dehydrogenase catalytic domain-containing protein [Trebonia sp.]|nr:alcohol dehydrogenase catalytic domain-containing protein [Trebonia sp.]